MRRAGAAPLEALSIDAGGVLLDPNWERIVDVLARHGIAADATALAAAEPHAKRTLDAPEYVGRTDDRSRAPLYWRLVLEGAGVDAPPERLAPAWAELEAYHRRCNLWETVLPGVPEALERLRRRGLRLVVVSNANGTLREKLATLGLRVDVIVDSHEVGVEKPDPRIFEIALAQAKVPPARVVHVGDLYEVDVVGARAAGLDAVLVDPLGLHEGRDCARVPSLAALAAALVDGA